MQLVTLNQKHEPIVSARNLHKELGIQKRFSSWFEQNANGFIEGEDFTGVPGGTPVQGGNGSIQFLDDYAMTLDMAKHISMLSRTDRGRDIRNYFIQVEKEYNSPDKIIARALLIANHKVLALETQVEEMKPKVRFADAVQASETSCLIGTLAGLITENGYKIGQNRLFAWLRENGYLHKSGSRRNDPVQRYIEMGLFEIALSTRTAPDGSTFVTRTTKVTGKGQIYFINKFSIN